MKVVISKAQSETLNETLKNTASAHDAFVAIYVEIAGTNGIQPGPASECTTEEKAGRKQLYERVCEIAQKHGVSKSTVSRAAGEAQLRYKITRKAQDWQPGIAAGRLLVKLLELATLDKKITTDLCKLLELNDANRLHVTKTAIELRDAKGNTTGRVLLQAGKFEVVTKPAKVNADKANADKATGEQIASVKPVSDSVAKVRGAADSVAC
jgi:hypothetical protein